MRSAAEFVDELADGGVAAHARPRMTHLISPLPAGFRAMFRVRAAISTDPVRADGAAAGFGYVGQGEGDIRRHSRRTTQKECL